MKCYNLLLILFMIALKCGADEELTTVNDFTVENIRNCDVFNTSTTESKLPVINSSTEPNVSGNTLSNATDDSDIEVKKVEFGLPISRKLTQQETVVKSIVGIVLKELIEPNDDDEDDEEETTVNYSTVENVTNSEVPNASTTEAPENSANKWTELPNITSLSESTVGENTLINATGTKAVSPFKRKEFGKLSIPLRLSQHKGIRTLTNIIGSLMKGLTKLNEPDSDGEADDEEQTFGNYSTVENDTKCVVSSASTAEGLTQNINSSSESPVVKNTLINATGAHTISPFKKKEVGKLSIPWRMPHHRRNRIVTNVKGNLTKMLAQLNEPDSEEDLKEEIGKLSIPCRMPQHRRNRIVTNIKGNLTKMLAQLNEPDSEEDLAANAEPATVNYSAVDNVTNVFNGSTTEAPDKSSTEPSGAENTLINATNDNAAGPFKKKEFGKLLIPIRLPLHGPRMAKNIIESLVKGFVQRTDLNEDTY